MNSTSAPGQYQQDSQQADSQSKRVSEKAVSAPQKGRQVPAFCPSCGHPTKAGADICENCGAWLLEGLCTFCYAELESGAAFCHECGNPTKGVACHSCGKLSIFDFCTHCNLPLTVQARESMEELSQSLERAMQRIEKEMSLSDALESKAEVHEGEQDKQAFSWDRFLEKNLDNLVKEKKEELKRKTDEEKKEELMQAVLEKALEEIQHQTFSDQQTARRHYGALKVLLPTITLVKVKKKITLGWRCYAFDVVHPHGPQECAEPHRGGEWIFDTIEEDQQQTNFEEHSL